VHETLFIFRQNKVLIGKGTELVLLSYNDMTVLDLQVTFKIFLVSLRFSQGVTTRCRLFWLTNSSLVHTYMSPNAGEGGGGVMGSQPMSTAVHMEPKLWKYDITSYLNCGFSVFYSCAALLRMHYYRYALLDRIPLSLSLLLLLSREFTQGR
jgi:hypothetical protein